MEELAPSCWKRAHLSNSEGRVLYHLTQMNPEEMSVVFCSWVSRASDVQIWKTTLHTWQVWPNTGHTSSSPWEVKMVYHTNAVMGWMTSPKPAPGTDDSGTNNLGFKKKKEVGELEWNKLCKPIWTITQSYCEALVLCRAILPNFVGKAHLYSESSCYNVTHGYVSSDFHEVWSILLYKKLLNGSGDLTSSAWL